MYMALLGRKKILLSLFEGHGVYGIMSFNESGWLQM